MTLDQCAQIATVLGLFVAVMSLAGTVFLGYRYIQIRASEQRQKRFDTYHGLIKLALGDSGDDKNLADRQALAIYELRSYREYDEITKRILNRLRDKAVASGDKSPPVLSVIEEIEITLSWIDKSIPNPATK